MLNLFLPEKKFIPFPHEKGVKNVYQTPYGFSIIVNFYGFSLEL